MRGDMWITVASGVSRSDKPRRRHPIGERHPTPADQVRYEAAG
jgi:hypothetical protein